MEEGRKTSDAVMGMPPHSHGAELYSRIASGHLVALFGGSNDVGTPRSHGTQLRPASLRDIWSPSTEAHVLMFLLGHRNGLLLGPRGRPETAKGTRLHQAPNCPPTEKSSRSACDVILSRRSGCPGVGSRPLLLPWAPASGRRGHWRRRTCRPCRPSRTPGRSTPKRSRRHRGS